MSGTPRNRAGIQLPNWIYNKAKLAHEAAFEGEFFATDEDLSRVVVDAVKGDIVRYAMSCEVKIRAVDGLGPS